MLRRSASLWPTVSLRTPVFVRFIREEQLQASADAVAELLESVVQKARKKKDVDKPKILTTRREALSLYREVLRVSRMFVWRDDKGRLWRDVIRHSTRQEFEAARFEQDPELISRLIVTGRECVQRSLENFEKRRQAIQAEEDRGLGLDRPLRF